MSMRIEIPKNSESKTHNETRPQQSPTKAIVSSRKGVLMIFAVVLVLTMVIGLETAIVYLTIKGKLTVEAAIQTSFGNLFVGALGLIGPIMTNITAIAKEDAAEKSSSSDS